MIHPNDEAVAQSKLEALAESSNTAQLTQHPLTVHLVILLSYMAHWQDYLESLASDLEQIVSKCSIQFMQSSQITATTY